MAFLQGLLTQDLRSLENQPAVYTLQLNRMGRIMGDAWILSKDENIWWMDTENAHEVASELNNKRLRYKVQFEAIDIKVWAGWGDEHPPQGSISDTRHPNLGWRFYGEINKEEGKVSADQYRLHTLSLGVPDGSLDFEIGRAMPLPWGCEHAVGWDKGCYVGQEPVARSHYQGVVRQHILPILFQENNAWKVDENKNIVDASGANQGRLISRFQNRGLGLVSIDIKDHPLCVSEISL